MSGIAKVLHERGATVTGSDLKESRYARMLEDIGVSVSIGHAEENLGDPEIVVISSAIPEKNPELKAAKERSIPVWPRAKMLAHLAEDRKTVAVAGTHGKTTTSSMVATMLGAMEQDPTFLIGGEVDSYGTNAACGSGEHYVVEADESDGSFMFLDPDIALVTNVEADHLDHYGSLEQVEQIFIDFMKKVPEAGTIIICGDDVRLSELAKEMKASLLSYGSREGANLRYSVENVDCTGSDFKVTLPDGFVVEARIDVPGEHMVANATGALAAAYALGLDVAAAARALSTFSGVRRRFDHIGTVGQVSVVDDYAHHPTEVRVTLQAARDCGYDRVWAIFQPHRYSRTEDLQDDFAKAFDLADRVVMMDIYSAGETPIPGVSGKSLVDSILMHDARSRIAYLPHRADIAPYLTSRVREGDLVMTMGAGHVTTIAPELVRVMESREGDGRITCR